MLATRRAGMGRRALDRVFPGTTGAGADIGLERCGRRSLLMQLMGTSLRREGACEVHFARPHARTQARLAAPRLVGSVPWCPGHCIPAPCRHRDLGIGTDGQWGMHPPHRAGAAGWRGPRGEGCATEMVSVLPPLDLLRDLFEHLVDQLVDVVVRPPVPIRPRASADTTRTTAAAAATPAATAEDGRSNRRPRWQHSMRDGKRLRRLKQRQQPTRRRRQRPCALESSIESGQVCAISCRKSGRYKRGSGELWGGLRTTIRKGFDSAMGSMHIEQHTRQVPCSIEDCAEWYYPA
eukprot:gene14253-biopygen2757